MPVPNRQSSAIGDPGFRQGGGNLAPPLGGVPMGGQYPAPTQIPVNFTGVTGSPFPGGQQLPTNQWLGGPPAPPWSGFGGDTGFQQGGGNLRPPIPGTIAGGQGYPGPQQIPIQRQAQQMPGWAGYLQWLNQQRLTPRWGPIPGINGWA